MAGHSVTFAAAVPTVWLSVLAVLSERGARLPVARLFVSGGAPLPAALLAQADRAGLPLIHSYGMTEATPLVLVGRTKSTLAREPAAAGFARRLRQGLPVPGVEVSVVTEDGRPASRDGAEIGELLIRGPWVAEEYERDPRGADVFVDGWYHTGDIVSIDDQGYVKVVDRKADLIKSGGEWISTVDVENVLLEHPAVRLACVVGLPDERWSERPVAALVLEPGVRDPADDELRRYLGAHFPKWWLPERFIRLDALPLTSVGKYDKKGLRSLLNGGRAVRPDTRPDTP
jgi:fatty-acyl-CoA synthase